MNTYIKDVNNGIIELITIISHKPNKETLSMRYQLNMRSDKDCATIRSFALSTETLDTSKMVLSPYSPNFLNRNMEQSISYLIYDKLINLLK